MASKYRVIIGAEIHVELNTNSKMFCGCKNDPFNAKEPNTYTCPVCLGLPGALPVANDKAIDCTIMIGKALNCKIADASIFDRKHYFYPDLPKGYQISQQSLPLCFNGFLETNSGKIRINRVHLEEDTAKLIHEKVNGKRASLIDFNRSGVPLIEIVTEPDIKSPEEAKEFLKKIRTIIRFLGVSDADMEKGSMRLEANISLSKTDTLPDYKVEVKNINSFRFYEQAVEYEIKRQSSLLDEGKTPDQETRGWDEESGKTVSQRSKESAQEYGYFPEPDIPPLDITEERLTRVKNSMPMLPDEYKSRLVSLGVPDNQSKELAKTKDIAEYVIASLSGNKKEYAEEVANRIINKRIDVDKVAPEELVPLIKREEKETISDEGEVESMVEEVIKENKKAVGQYKEGKEEALGFLMGQVMQKSKGKVDAKVAKNILINKLR